MKRARWLRCGTRKIFPPASWTKLLADRRGATAIEFAFIGPVFLLVLFGAFDIGRIVLTSATMEFAAQEGVHFASLRGSSSLSPATAEQIADRVRSLVRGIDAGAVRVTVSWSPDPASGSTVSVTTGYEYRVLMGLVPLPPLALGGRASLTVM